MGSLTILSDCLMNFLVAASGAIGSPSGPTSVIMYRLSSFFVGPHFVLFCCDDDPDGYTKTFIYLHGHLDGKYSNHSIGNMSVTVGNGLRNRFSKWSGSVKRQRESVERMCVCVCVCGRARVGE